MLMPGCCARRGAVEQPTRVRLPLHLQKAIVAAHSGALHEEDPALRVKPRFRMPKPGVKAMIGANLLLFYILLTVRV